jgi:hypothetical protein
LLAITILSLATAAASAAAAKPVTLGPGQAAAIGGTDLVCAFGGPVNAIGIACLHTKTGTLSFRMNENELIAYQQRSGKLSQAGRWKEPRTVSEPKSPAVSKFKLVATLPIGGRILAAGLDLGCLVYSHSGRPNVACFKLGPGKGYPAVGSYAAAIDAKGLQVSQFDAAHKGTTVYVGTEGK